MTDRIVTYNGQQWRIAEVQRTSDGFLLGSGFLQDPDTGADAIDEDGYPVYHSFFLGRAPSGRVQ